MNYNKIYQGEANETFYFVEKGSCKVLKDGKELFVVKAGEYFGEISLLKN